MQNCGLLSRFRTGGFRYAEAGIWITFGLPLLWPDHFWITVDCLLRRKKTGNQERARIGQKIRRRTFFVSEDDELELLLSVVAEYKTERMVEGDRLGEGKNQIPGNIGELSSIYSVRIGMQEYRKSVQAKCVQGDCLDQTESETH